MSLLFPICASSWTILVKYVNKNVRLENNDWMQAYNIFLSVATTVVGICSWCTHEGSFEWKFFYMGLVAGIGTLIAATLCVYALNVDKSPQGPCAAVIISTRMLLLVAFDSILTLVTPAAM